MKKYWFKPKKYGYGVYPISWEGWLATLLLIGLLFASAYINNFFEPTAEIVTIKNGLQFLLDVVILAGLFMLLITGKVNGELKWRWG